MQYRENHTYALGMRIIFSAFFILLGCSKEEGVNPTPLCRLSKITTSYLIAGTVTSKTTYSFTYDGTNFLVKYTVTTETTGSATIVSTYTYNYASGLVSTITSGTTKSDWTHQNGRVKSVVTTITSSSGNATESAQISYDIEGNLTQFTNSFVPASPRTIQALSYDGNGNLITNDFEISSPGSPPVVSYSQEFSGYDLSNNPYSLLAEATGQPVFLSANGAPYFLAVSRNNPGTEVNGGDTYDYDYTYTSKNYPATMERKSAAEHFATQYEYVNCN